MKLGILLAGVPLLAFATAQGAVGNSSARSMEEAVLDFKPTSTGTGFFISEDGFLVTNEHVVKNATEVEVCTSTGRVGAKIIAVDEANDLALLKAAGVFTPLTVASSRSVKVSAAVITVGFPDWKLQGFAPKFAKGEIASLTGPHDDPRYFQISVPIQPGNSGSALVDEYGNVVGVISATLNFVATLKVSRSLPQNVNYAVKSGYLMSFLESVPELMLKLRQPSTNAQSFGDVVGVLQQATALVMCRSRLTNGPTALMVAKKANSQVGEEDKDKIVQIRSEKSSGSLSPSIWYVVLYDSKAKLKAIQVKFASGTMLESKRPGRLLERLSRASAPIEKSSLRLDSDEAIEIAKQEPLLEKVNLTASKLTLEHKHGAGVWKVKFWASKIRRPTEDVDIGEVWLSTKDGKVLKRDLHLNRIH